MTDRPFSDRQAKYAAWRNQMKANAEEAKLDLRGESEPEPTLSDMWSTESLLAESRAIAARESRVD